MNALLRLSLVALLALLLGCATNPSRHEVSQKPKPTARQIARQHRYERLLAKVQPGMTRRQLYAILPPRGIPRAEPPRLFDIIGLPSFLPLTETHRLDDDFYLLVQYRIARVSEYPLPPFAPGSSTKWEHLPFTLGGPGSPASRENPRDELLIRPALAGPGVRTAIELVNDVRFENFVTDKRQLKNLPRPESSYPVPTLSGRPKRR